MAETKQKSVRNGDILDQVKELAGEFKKFNEQYIEDMRGDGEHNGKHGLIADIRELKEYKNEYPSFRWMFAHKPISTLAGVLGCLVVFQALWTVGLIKLLGAMLGLDISLIP